MAAYKWRMMTDSLKAQQVFLTELGHTTPYFAYPYGGYTPDMVQILRAVGYNYLFTVINGSNGRHEDRLYLYRVNCGVPWMTPVQLVTNIRLVAEPSKLPHHPKQFWLPR